MSTQKSPVLSNELFDDKAFVGDIKNIHIHQYFTRYFIAILLILIVSFSLLLLSSSQQNKQSMAIVSERVTPLQAKFTQQSHLIKINNLIRNALQNAEADQLVLFQENISFESKKLSLIESPHQGTFQHWFSKNNSAIDLVTEISSNNEQAELLKNKTLMQLDTLIDAIGVQLRKSKIKLKSVKLLSNLNIQLNKVMMMLQQVTLQTSLDEFAILQANIDAMFVADYGKILASQKNKTRAMEELVRDFIHFEDLVLQRSLLTNWKRNLTLVAEYQQLLISEQEVILSTLNQYQKDDASNNVTGSKSVKNHSVGMLNITTGVWVITILALLAITALLALIRLRIKVSSSYGVSYLSNILENGVKPGVGSNENQLSNHLHQAFYCAESYQLLEKVLEVNNSRFSEPECISLLDRNLSLELETIEKKDEYERLNDLVAFTENSIVEKVSKQVSIERQWINELYLSVVKQMQLFGRSAIDGSKDNLNSENSYLLQSYQEAKNLSSKLEQLNSHRYLQSDNALLNLSDVNFIAQLQAAMFTLNNKFSTLENSLVIDVDDQISSFVNMDVQLFIELFNVYIALLIGQEKALQLTFNIKLIDQNNGQQKISFYAKVMSEGRTLSLPEALQNLSDTDSEKTEINKYFMSLLDALNGDDITAKLIDEGYQLSFSLPLAVVEKQNKQALEEQQYSWVIPQKNALVKEDITQLNDTFFAMPVEVLLAVKSPLKYQTLQLALQHAGLQVHIVSNEFMSDKYWKTGLFSTLLTDISCDPFIDSFISENTTGASADDELQEGRKAFETILPRGVISLGSALSITTQNEQYADWNIGSLTSNSTIQDITEVMSPWLKEIKSSDDTIQENNSKLLNDSTPFDFDSYVKHQGSLEIAIYMLDDYIAENTALAASLKQAYVENDFVGIESTISTLTINSKVMAAGKLKPLCQKWQLLLDEKALDSADNEQVQLLKQTMQTIKVINQYAEKIA